MKLIKYIFFRPSKQSLRLTRYIFLFFLLNLLACTDYLKEEALTDVSIDFLYNSPEGLKAGVVGLYSQNRKLYGIWPNESSKPLWTYVQNDLTLARAGYISIISQFAKSANAPDQYGAFISKLIWRHYYTLIDRANALIEAGEKIKGMDETERTKAVGEARLFRAYALFTLWRLYNNVYVKTNSTTPENVFERVNKPSTKEEIFAALHEDFDYAIEHLPWKDEAGRMTRAVAHHLKAKAALWEEDWATAAQHADELINNGSYQLESDLKKIFGHPSLSGYGDRNSSEALFVVQNEEGVAGGGGAHFMNVNFMTKYDKVQGAKYSAEQGGRGFGFLYPNQYLLNLYESFDKRLEAYYITKFYYNDEANLPDGVELGDQIIIPNEGSNQAKFYERVHPSCIKFYDENIPPESAVSRSSVLIYRLSETYIIAAEAYMRMGDQGKAFDRINVLTTRANVPPIFNLDELQLMQEHARELAFEGHRFYFLKRIGRLVSQVEKFAGDDDFKNEARANIKAHYVNLPIPQSELELLGAGYPQNEGY